MNVAIVIFLIWMMFAIIGINFSKGKLNYCDMGDDEMYYLTKQEVFHIFISSVLEYGEFMIVILKIFFLEC